METRLSLLSHISYTASYKIKKANADIMLEGEADWIMLIRDAEAFRSNSRNKNKVWSIRIYDKSVTDAKESTNVTKVCIECSMTFTSLLSISEEKDCQQSK